MAASPEKIIHRTSEIMLTTWNCIVPRKAPGFPPVVAYQGFVDGAAIATIIKLPETGDIALAVIMAGAASYIHYLGRRACGDWKEPNYGKKSKNIH